ncbi:hypothetical protein [Staphylococcus coagulans]|uniref:hypothetical protein n=1 Tax=Staphylococcus coagulans TaxID=74706 RepID=UPI0015F7EA03|nr:hypothetical protein [Staphylococcus coagulans]MBA8761513.1 hypothetical protein [Staphylococcus coagulans]
MISLILYQLLLLFGVVVLYLLIAHGYLTPDYMVMVVMMILTIFFSYIYYLLAFNKDDKGSDFKRLFISTVVFISGFVLAIYLIIKVFVNFY